MPGKEPSRNAPTTNGSAIPPVDYSNFYKTTGLMAGFNFFMTVARFGRTANVLASSGFLYGLHQVGKTKLMEQKAANSTPTIVPAAVEKALSKITLLFFQSSKPPEAMTLERIISTVSKSKETIFVGGGEVVNRIYKP